MLVLLALHLPQLPMPLIRLVVNPPPRLTPCNGKLHQTDATMELIYGSQPLQESLSNPNLSPQHHGATTHLRTLRTTKHGAILMMENSSAVEEEEEAEVVEALPAITNLSRGTTIQLEDPHGEDHLVLSMEEEEGTSAPSPTTSSNLGTRTLEVQEGITLTTETVGCKTNKEEQIMEPRIEVEACGEEEETAHPSQMKTMEVGLATHHNVTMPLDLVTLVEGVSTGAKVLWEALVPTLDGEDLPLPPSPLQLEDGKDREDKELVLEVAREVINNGMETVPPWEEGTLTSSMMEREYGEEKQETNLVDLETGDGRICRYRISLAVPPDPPAECPPVPA